MRGMMLQLIQVDAFTNQQFRGNPAAVCLLQRPASLQWMQRVAHEMNLSETAFVHPDGQAFQLRWFTPTSEVDLCGHATLATAHVLWEAAYLDPADTARFLTKSGELTAVLRGDWIEMDFPATPVQPATVALEWHAVLGVEPVFVGKTCFDLFVEIGTDDALARLRPDLAAIAALPHRGLIVTARASSSYDFVSRFFAPAVGIPEDPVTGSAHCALAPYWSNKLGRRHLCAFQASSRGGELRLCDHADRVTLAGQAVTVFHGTLLA
jgi:PhzF family phenazine biosynthesis protein